MDFRPPRIRDNLRFFGDSKCLTQFLLEIHEELDQIRFPNDNNNTQKINWISQHFTSLNSTPSSTQIWFMGLLERNAVSQGIHNKIGNLKCIPYQLPELSSLENFLGELWFKFGDKHAEKTARDQLNACKQGKGSIVDYNSRFEQLSFHVKKSEEDKILQYIDGLHPSIQLEATRIKGWVQEANLLRIQDMAVKAADILDLRSRLTQNFPHLKTQGEIY